LRIELTGKPLTWLGFDIEARPLSWMGGDWVTREITAIAWKVIGDSGKPLVVLLGELTPREMLGKFLEYYNGVDAVTGHFVRGYDLPTLNASLLEHGFGPLPEKLSHDTKNDLVKLQGNSKSLENLAATLGVKGKKVGMSQADWRQANRLLPEGLKKTAVRVSSDVELQIQVREELMKRGYLSRPKLWRPGAK
jgi:hypothetical protein